MREAAAERAAGADRQVPDVAGRLGEEVPGAGELRPLEPSVTDERSELERVAGGDDPVEPGHAVDVDEVRGAREPVGEERHEALPAGEQLRVLAAVGEQRERVVERFGARVRERRRLHAVPRRAASVAARIGA